MSVWETSKMNKSSICSIVVTYNAITWIDKCLRSLLGSECPTDVVVVDNHSSDNTVTHIQRNYSGVHVIKNLDNLGFGSANNQGLRYCYLKGYSYYFLLNQDAWIDKDTLCNLKEAQEENDQLGVVSPIHLNGDRTGYDQLFLHFVTEDISIDFLERNSSKWETTPVHFVNAAAWLLSKECLEKVGVFHPLFFHYGEDFNYVQRLYAEGLKVGLVNNTFAVHDREDRSPSKIKHDPIRRLERDLLLKLLEPDLGYGWMDYSIYMGHRLKAASKDLSWSEFWSLCHYAIKQYRFIYRSARDFQKENLMINLISHNLE